ncbi:GNAT family N-acetyltransferase [Desulfosporosinus lacus]|uniref:Ribosomal protein S18 acetylase RimI n=1 Tax=Desulfosporosinus lacus DSM 15449 TaxID=1121420 RepID=A0A1M5X738_9FIRM|nr:GNAT family N-acetyltransferase [Desulfosporosinus lacus]SHH95462.1 Ribosomal protein S18 acetylase RimI [Desulfosporosinus lacus DSM 15449]
MNISIRNALLDDFESVYPLFKQLWPTKVINRSALKAVYDRGVISQTDELLCVVLDEKVIGFCAYAIVNNLWQEGYISYIYAMVINENQRGKGYGSALINECIQRSKEQGMKRIELDSGFPRKKAHEFYIKLGFEKRAYLFSYDL